jgi:hypothetical protein
LPGRLHQGVGAHPASALYTPASRGVMASGYPITSFRSPRLMR